MIRIRTTGGQVEEVPGDSRFVEICDVDGKVAKVTFIDSAGNIRELTDEPGEGGESARRYAETFGVEFVPLIKLPEHA